MQDIVGPWLASLKQYCLMCLFLSSPERLPFNPYCIPLTVFAYFAIALALVDAERGYASIFAQIILELVLLGAMAYTALRWKNLLPRLPQTMSALIGINFVITAATIPVYRAIAAQGENPDNMLVYATFAILVWNLAVLSLIFKRAFEISTRLSAVLSFNYFVVYQLIVIWLF